MSTVWAGAPQHPSLNPTDVHIWRASLALPAASVAALREVLSEDERARADRFVFARDRDKFIAARGRLRHILAAYLDVQPNAIGFEYGPYGKPQLSSPKTDVRLQFNVSHSGDLALVAVAWGRRVGIDLEDARRECAYLEIANSVFSAHERAALAALPEAQQRMAFYTIWTRKEAFIKAHGEGLSYPLDRFSVSAELDGPVTLALADGAGEGRWTLHGLKPGDGYVGALAVEGGVMSVRLFEVQ